MKSFVVNEKGVFLPMGEEMNLFCPSFGVQRERMSNRDSLTIVILHFRFSYFLFSSNCFYFVHSIMHSAMVSM